MDETIQGRGGGGGGERQKITGSEVAGKERLVSFQVKVAETGEKREKIMTVLIIFVIETKQARGHKEGEDLTGLEIR